MQPAVLLSYSMNGLNFNVTISSNEADLLNIVKIQIMPIHNFLSGISQLK